MYPPFPAYWKPEPGTIPSSLGSDPCVTTQGARPHTKSPFRTALFATGSQEGFGVYVEVDVDGGSDVEEDRTEEAVMTADELKIEDAAEDKEGEDVADAIEVANDDVVGSAVEIPTDETVVKEDELDCKAAAEEKASEAVEDVAAVVDNTAMELDTDDIAG